MVLLFPSQRLEGFSEVYYYDLCFFTVESSPDKNNVQSAVLGMLSLSQQSHQLPLHYSYNNAATVTRQNNFDNEHIISPTGSESRHGSAALILTPPGELLINLIQLMRID